MAIHEQSIGSTDEWYTPPYIFEAMGVAFDIDVASPGKDVTPWIPAKSFITSCSLSSPWRGFIWMNPPFGKRNGIYPWLDRFFEHGNGVALTPDRTSAPWWQTYAKKAELILFISPKIKFIGKDGKTGKSPAQGTSLMGIGEKARIALYNAEKNGLGVLL